MYGTPTRPPGDGLQPHQYDAVWNQQQHATPQQQQQSYGGGHQFQQQQQQQGFYQTAARVPLRVSFLTAFAHSASQSILHVYQSAEPHRVAVGPPARRVLILVDETTFNQTDLERQIQRCTAFSKIEEVMVLPHDAKCITESGSRPLTDLDVLLQQATPFDFIRTVGALYRSTMSGGAPPLFELDEGQPLAVRVHCRLRQKPLPDAIVDGISKDAMKRLNEEHGRQLQAMRIRLEEARKVQTSELVETYGERDDMKKRLQQAEAEILRLQRLGREDRDVAKLQLAEMAEDLRKAREEITMLKLVRVGALPDAASSPSQASAFYGGGGFNNSSSSHHDHSATPNQGGYHFQPQPNGNPDDMMFAPQERSGMMMAPQQRGQHQQQQGKPSALSRLEAELRDGEQFLAKVRSNSGGGGDGGGRYSSSAHGGGDYYSSSQQVGGAAAAATPQQQQQQPYQGTGYISGQSQLSSVGGDPSPSRIYSSSSPAAAASALRTQHEEALVKSSPSQYTQQQPTYGSSPSRVFGGGGNNRTGGGAPAPATSSPSSSPAPQFQQVRSGSAASSSSAPNNNATEGPTTGFATSLRQTAPTTSGGGGSVGFML